MPIELPPLRNRREDILPLAQHFIRKYAEENGREISENMSAEVLSLLENYYYPGNVRELENIIERAVVIAQTNELTVECLRPEVRDPDLATEMIRSTEGKSADIDISRGVNFYDEVKRFEIDLIRTGPRPDRRPSVAGGAGCSGLTPPPSIQRSRPIIWTPGRIAKRPWHVCSDFRIDIQSPK